MTKIFINHEFLGRRLSYAPKQSYLAPCIKSAPRRAGRHQPSLRHGGCHFGDAALAAKED
jgi:hypothetical protein